MIEKATDFAYSFAQKTVDHSKKQQTKMLVSCQRFSDLFLFGLVWQCSTSQNPYNKGRFIIDFKSEGEGGGIQKRQYELISSTQNELTSIMNGP